MTTTNSHPSPGDSTPAFYDPAPILGYVRRHLDKGWTVDTYARAAGMRKTNLLRHLNRHAEKMTRTTARRLLTVDGERLYEAATISVPAHLVRWQLGSLCAIGWPCSLMAEHLGYSQDTILKIVNGTTRRIGKDAAEDIAFFFDKVRLVPSTSRNRRQAMAMAVRYGFRRPEEYAPDGTLWEDDVRDETIGQRWDRRDRESWLHMEVARSALGLKWARSTNVAPLPGQDERIAEILAVVERWLDAGPTADAWPFCVELGMMDTALWNGLDNKPMLVAA